MAILDPDHLLQQAGLLVKPRHGRPRQVDVRRAISSAYYAVFHAILTAAADEFVGAANRAEPRYGLAFRSISHTWLRALCDEASKPHPAKRYRPYFPDKGFGQEIQSFADAVSELQQKRHLADYDIMVLMKRSDAELTIEVAREAIVRFRRAPSGERVAFLSLLLFSPRS